MERIELYDFDDVTNYLKGTKFIKQSANITLVALWPVDEDEGLVKILKGSILTRRGNFSEGFNRYRSFIKSCMIGCDYYYEIKVAPETTKMRRDLSLSKTLVDVDTDGIGTIEEKKHFRLYNLKPEVERKIASLPIDKKISIILKDDSYAIDFDESNKGFENGYALTAGEVARIDNLGLKDSLLTEDRFKAFIQKGLTMKEISIEEALDTTVSYYPGDKFENNESNILPRKNNSTAKGKIITFYEYDPYVETPSFGSFYELVNMGTDSNGTPIWRKVPKILQNEHDAEYANRALMKGVRTVTLLPDDVEKNKAIMKKLEQQGKLDQVKEFVVFDEMGEDFLIEQNGLNKTIETGFTL